MIPRSQPAEKAAEAPPERVRSSYKEQGQRGRQLKPPASPQRWPPQLCKDPSGCCSKLILLAVK